MLRRFFSDERGNAMVEMAAVLPMMVMVFLGSLEFARYSMLVQKLDRAAVTLADLVSRDETTSTAELAMVFDAVSQITLPFQLDANGVAIISGITGEDGTPRIQWQQSGAGGLVKGSNLGVQGGVAQLPPDFTLANGEGTVAAEIFFQFTPMWFPDLVDPAELYFRAFFRPRRSTEVVFQ